VTTAPATGRDYDLGLPAWAQGSRDLRAALGAGGAGAWPSVCFPNQEWNAMRASAYREERVVA
jgi:hypothetical protein